MNCSIDGVGKVNEYQRWRIKNQEQVDYVMTIIKDSREVKYTADIKRYGN